MSKRRKYSTPCLCLCRNASHPTATAGPVARFSLIPLLVPLHLIDLFAILIRILLAP